MRRLAAVGALDVTSARATLEKHFVEYAGDHTGIVKEQPGSSSFLDHLARELGPAS